MTILVSAYVQEGIVMAADSRLTVSHDKNGKIEKYTSSDNMMKIFLLKKLPIGISSSGDAYINNKILSEFIKEFENEILNENDNIEIAAEKLMMFLQLNDANMRIQMCGYHNNTPYVYLIDQYSCVRYNTDSDGQIIYNVLWNGHGEAISNLLLGQFPMKFDFRFMPLKDAIEFVEFLVDVVIKSDRFKEGLSYCGGPIDILVLTPEYAEFYRHKILKP